MRDICKDYYKYSKDEDVLVLFKSGLLGNSIVRSYVAFARITPLSMLLRLLNDSNEDVKYQAQVTLSRKHLNHETHL